jgi:16S rRNA (cytosine967-C5)-methyltransferase
MQQVKPRGPRSQKQAPRPEPAGFEARRVAQASVAEVLRTSAGLDEVLARYPGSDPLARAIAVTTFRRLGTLGRILNERLAKGLSADERAFALLATGAAQILFLNVPDHAAVDLCVELARSDPKLRHLTGLANAVLRRIARDRESILAGGVSPLEDAPVWLAERWSATYGIAQATSIAEAHREGATVDLSVKSDPEGWADRLGGMLLPSGSIRLSDRTAVPELSGFEAGEWWVQDAAAAIPARLLGARPGERVLDLCAAPGGKTAQLAVAGAKVTALDRSASRLNRLRQNLDRLRLEAEVVCRDGLTFEAPPFDAVLLDAPCTATGTIRRHPDVAWTKKEGDLASLCDLQRRMLDHAATLVRPGGRLVYCVCSLEPEEGERQAAAFLDRHPEFERIPVREDETGLGQAAMTGDGDLRTLPHARGLPEAFGRGLDGFFALRVSRKPA